MTQHPGLGGPQLRSTSAPSKVASATTAVPSRGTQGSVARERGMGRPSLRCTDRVSSTVSDWHLPAWLGKQRRPMARRSSSNKNNHGAAGDTAAPMKFLIGDTNGDSNVNSADAIQRAINPGNHLHP